MIRFKLLHGRNKIKYEMEVLDMVLGGRIGETILDLLSQLFS